MEEMRKKIDELVNLKKQVSELRDSVDNLSGRVVSNAKQGNTATYASQLTASASKSVNEPAQMFYHRKEDDKLDRSAGMKNDTNLRVGLPAVSSSQTGFQNKHLGRRPLVVGSKRLDQSTLRASQKPKEFHLHVGNLDLNTTEDQVKDYVAASGTNLRILSCEIVHSKRWSEQRSLSAHVIINANDRDLAFSSECWPLDVTVRPWRRPKRDSWYDTENTES